jgi:HlyD family secretion protein
MSQAWKKESNGFLSENKQGENAMRQEPRNLFDESILLKPKVPWWRRRRWQVGIIAFILLAILLRVVFVARSAAHPSITYQYQKVTQGDLALSVSATGPVQGTVYNVDFEDTGKIQEIDVQLNQRVKAGQLLAKLDSTQLQDGVNQAQDAVDQAQATGNTAALATTRSQLKLAQDKLHGAILTAPHAGVVTAINGTLGGFPGRSSTGGASSFLQITDETTLQVQAYVNEADIGQVAKGQTTQFTVSAYGQQPFYGTINAITSMGVVVSNIVTYPVTIDIDMKRLQGSVLFPGMTANVTIETVRHPHVLLIPVSAAASVHTALARGLITRDQVNAVTAQAQQMLTASGKGTAKDAPVASCLLVLEENQWMIKPVLLGLTDGVSYEVVEGVAVDQVVMTNIQDANA